MSRGLALYQSMALHIVDFKLFVLALDKEVVKYFEQSNHPEIEVLELKDVEHYFPELIVAKENRSLVEYYFTLSPALPLYILEKNKTKNKLCALFF